MSAKIKAEIHRLKQERRSKIGEITKAYQDLEKAVYAKCDHNFCDWHYNPNANWTQDREVRDCWHCGLIETRSIQDA